MFVVEHAVEGLPVCDEASTLNYAVVNFKFYILYSDIERKIWISQVEVPKRHLFHLKDY